MHPIKHFTITGKEKKWQGLAGGRGRGREEGKKKNDFDKVTKSKHQLIIVTLQVSLRKQMLIVTVNRN